MPSTFSANRGYELIATGEMDGTWGVKTDSNLSIIDLNISGRLSLNVAGNSNVTLNAAQAQNLLVGLTGVLTGNVTVFWPAKGGLFYVTNSTTGAFTVTVAMTGGTDTHVIAQGTAMLIGINPDGNLGVARIAVNPQVGPGVAAGTYNWANIIIDDEGHISSITANVPPIPSTGGTVNGNLAVTGTLTNNGQFTKTASDSFAYSVPNGGYAIIRYTVAGTRAWWSGVDASGFFNWFDASAGVSQMNLSYTGVLSVANGINTNGSVTAAGLQANSNALVGGAVYVNYPTVSDFLLVRGGGVREVNFASNWALQWLESGGSLRWIANGAQVWIVDSAGNVSAGGQVFGNTVVANGITSNGNLAVAAQTSSNTVVANGITSNGAIAAAGGISAGGDMSCANGVAYNNHGAHTIGFASSGTLLTFFTVGGSSGSWNFNPSDERLKRNIAPARGDALAELCRLKLISYDLPLADAPTRHFDCGFSAQNVQAIIPDAVTEGEEYLIVDTLPLIARLVGAMQRLAERVEALEAKA